MDAYRDLHRKIAKTQRSRPKGLYIILTKSNKFA